MRCNGLLSWVLALVAAAWGFGLTARAADDNDVVGTWKLTVDSPDGGHEPVLTIKKEKAGYKAEYVEGERKLTARDIRFKDGKLRFKIESEYAGNPATTTFEGKVAGDAIKGECEW